MTEPGATRGSRRHRRTVGALLVAAAGALAGLAVLGGQDDDGPAPGDPAGGEFPQVWFLAALGAGAAGIILSVIGCFIQSAGAFLAAWMGAYFCWLAVPLGAIAALLVHDLTGGEWGFALRPVLVPAAASLLPFPLLFIALPLAGLDHMYSWAAAERAGAPPPNAFYLNTPGFWGRAAGYFIIWLLLGWHVIRRSRLGLLAVERGGSWISGVGLFALAITLTLASVDWVMSLDPPWNSSMFGLVMSGSFFSTGLAFCVLLALLGGWMVGGDPGLRGALAHILLASFIFWFYCEFMQYLIIWEENLTREIGWYRQRFRDGWGAISLVVVGGRFWVPFLLLIWRPLSRNPTVLGGCCALLLLMAQLYTWLLILPATPNGFTWIAPFAAIGIGGLCIACVLRLHGRILPLRAAAHAASEAPEHG